MFVAIPTAMPVEPFTIRFGMPAGRTAGSSIVSSKFGTVLTVFLSMSPNISIAMFINRDSV